MALALLRPARNQGRVKEFRRASFPPQTSLPGVSPLLVNLMPHEVCPHRLPHEHSVGGSHLNSYSFPKGFFLWEGELFLSSESPPHISLFIDVDGLGFHEDPYLEKDFMVSRRVHKVPRDMEDRLLMKRKGRSLAGKQQEACGVWLDTSALKRRKLQSFLGKPVLKVLSQPSSYSAPSKVSFLRTKQTAISTFFRPQQAGDGETTRNKSLLPVATNAHSNVKYSHLPARGEDPLPASVIHPVIMEKCSQQLVKKPQPYLPGNCHPVQAQLYNSCILRSTKDDHPAAEKEYPFSFDLAQCGEEKRVLDYVPVFEPPLRERNGDWKSDPPLSLLRESPKMKVASSQRAKFQRTYRDPSSDSENINPQLEKGMSQGKPLEGLRETPPGLLLQAGDHFCSSEKGPENSQGDVASSLFTQDSEGYKVISHCLPDRGKLRLQNKPLRGKNSSAVSPSHKGHSEACCSMAGGPRTSPGTTLSVLADMSEKSCYDLLFTEDSEGNKVIKH